MSPTQFILSGLMLVAGLGIPVMAAFNADLGARLNHPWAAVFILSCVAVLLSAVMVVRLGLPSFDAVQAAPKLYFFAGSIFILYIASITYAAPRIGLGNAVFLVLLGQLASSAVIDHFGLWSAPQSPITLKRTLGLMVMTLGIYLAQKDVSQTITPA